MKKTQLLQIANFYFFIIELLIQTLMNVNSKCFLAFPIPPGP